MQFLKEYSIGFFHLYISSYDCDGRKLILVCVSYVVIVMRLVYTHKSEIYFVTMKTFVFFSCIDNFNFNSLSKYVPTLQKIL